jgi:hypothetical protein
MSFRLLGPPLRGLLVALLGTILAWQWFGGDQLLVGAVLVVLLAAALVGRLIGDRALPAKPERAVVLLETWWFLSYTALAAGAACMVIVATVEFAAPKDAPAETTELLGALAAGITTFLTAAFISRENMDDAIGEFVRSRFHAHYKQLKPGATQEPRVHYFEPESDGLRLVYSEHFRTVSGWTRSARRTRAEKIADLLDPAFSSQME